jgi:membrane fusion protein, multidrug efflux system
MNEFLVQSDGTETAKGIRIRTRLNWEIPGTCDAKPKISNENCTNCLAHRTTHFFRRYYHRWIEYFDRRAESYAWLPHHRADLADLKLEPANLMRKMRWFFLLIGAVFVGGVWFYFNHQKNTANPDAAPGRNAGQTGRGGPGGPVPVVVGLVQKRDVPIYLDGIGTVQAYNTVTVHPQVSGTLTTVAFKEGQDVKKGDLIAVIDPRPFQAALDGAVAKKNQDIAQLNNAKVLLDRDTDLFKKGVLDHQTYDTQRFMVDQLDATVKADQAAIDNAQTQLSYTQITASFDARCGIRQVDQGNLVSSGSTLVVLTQLKPISVIFTLPQQNLIEINEASSHGALKVTALDSTQSKALAEGTLAVVDNEIDTTTGTIRLKANFPNEDLKLWPGQFVNTRLLVSTQKDGLVVPASVVQRGPNGTFAYVITPKNTAEMRTVEVGQIDGGQALINSGLQDGERVVVDGQYKLQPGALVQVTNPNRADGRPLAQNDRVPDPDQSMQPASPGLPPKPGDPGESAAGAPENQAVQASPSDQGQVAGPKPFGQNHAPDSNSFGPNGTGHRGHRSEASPASSGKAPSSAMAIQGREKQK